MAETRRGYIFGAFLLSILCVLLIVVSVASNGWILSIARAEGQVRDSNIQYGLFRGGLTINTFDTPSENVLYMTCVPEIGKCAISCKTEAQAREEEVRALAEGLRPNPACLAVTNIEIGQVDPPPVISFAFYVCLLAVLFLQLAFAVISAGLAIINATTNPTEPIFGLPGCIWSNAITAVLGLTVLVMFGIYYATSGLREHLAMGYIALDLFTASPGLGYSYWLLIAAVLCSASSVGLIELRRFLLERDPPPPTIKVENHSDGTIFLY